MSRIFGPIRQLGFIVRDIEVAMQHWLDVAGVGPWFVSDRFELPEFNYKGVRYTDFAGAFAWANSGDMQIELIQQLSKTPSMIKDFLAANPTIPPQGMLQHWGCWPEDYDAVYARAVAVGYAPGHSGRAESNSRNRFAYFHLNAGLPEGIEIAESPAPARAFRAMIRDAADSWDGENPIRRL